MAKEVITTLETLAGGAATELFQTQLLKAVHNILDPNTPATAKRTITLKVIVKPEESRKSGEVIVDCESKLPAPRGKATKLFFGRQAGQPVAVEVDPEQGGLFDGPKGDNVRQLGKDKD